MGKPTMLEFFVALFKVYAKEIRGVVMCLLAAAAIAYVAALFYDGIVVHLDHYPRLHGRYRGLDAISYVDR